VSENLTSKLKVCFLFQGVSEEPKFYYGATGAQSAVLPALDAALGVLHPPGWLSDYLKVMLIVPSLCRLSKPLSTEVFSASSAFFSIGSCILSFIRIFFDWKMHH
jgi:hypothetical protein